MVTFSSSFRTALTIPVQPAPSLASAATVGFAATRLIASALALSMARLHMPLACASSFKVWNSPDKSRTCWLVNATWGVHRSLKERSSFSIPTKSIGSLMPFAWPHKQRHKHQLQARGEMMQCLEDLRHYVQLRLCARCLIHLRNVEVEVLRDTFRRSRIWQSTIACITETAKASAHTSTQFKRHIGVEHAVVVDSLARRVLRLALEPTRTQSSQPSKPTRGYAGNGALQLKGRKMPSIPPFAALNNQLDLASEGFST